jgi:hypothetical protein
MQIRKLETRAKLAARMLASERTQARKHTSAEVHKRASAKACKRASTQARKVRTCANAQGRKPASTQPRKHTSSPAFHAMRQRTSTQGTKRTVKSSARPGLVIRHSGSSFKLIVPNCILLSTNKWAERASTKKESGPKAPIRDRRPRWLWGGLGVWKFLSGHPGRASTASV